MRMPLSSVTAYSCVQSPLRPIALAAKLLRRLLRRSSRTLPLRNALPRGSLVFSLASLSTDKKAIPHSRLRAAPPCRFVTLMTCDVVRS